MSKYKKTPSFVRALRRVLMFTTTQNRVGKYEKIPHRRAGEVKKEERILRRQQGAGSGGPE